jgi:sodium-dependent dicarboxylate transporter 2/3/5
MRGGVIKMTLDKKNTFFLLLGVGLLFLFHFLPPFAPAIDPAGKSFALSAAGKSAIGLFLLAGIWWVFEVMPIGVTSIAIGILQPLLMIRPAKEAMRDFMDPTVLFIFGSLLVGLTFTKVGLTKRLAYKMLLIVGEKTSMILLGSFVVTALLTHIMAHTAVAATVIPIFLTILALYNEDGGSLDKPNKFGKALFIGMAYTAGAGSICTLLGGARNPAALGFFKEFTGVDISFIDFSLHMAPLGWIIIFLIWLMIMVIFKPEKKTIPGLRQKAGDLYRQLGPLSKEEIFVMIVVACGLGMLIMQAVVPALKDIDRSIPLLLAGLVFFATGILDVQDLEKKIPWNIVLLFSGAMSMGFALWQSGAAQWMAIKWLSLLQGAPWLFFVLGVAVLVIIMTNFVMNVAAIAITLPVALVIAQYLGVNPQLILYVATAAAGMPMLLLIGAAPNAMAYESKQFSTGEFFTAGIPGTILVLVIMTIFAFTYWPLIGLTPLIK